MSFAAYFFPLSHPMCRRAKHPFLSCWACEASSRIFTGCLVIVKFVRSRQQILRPAQDGKIIHKLLFNRILQRRDIWSWLKASAPKQSSVNLFKSVILNAVKNLLLAVALSRSLIYGAAHREYGSWSQKRPATIAPTLGHYEKRQRWSNLN